MPHNCSTVLALKTGVVWLWDGAGVGSSVNLGAALQLCVPNFEISCENEK